MHTSVIFSKSNISNAVATVVPLKNTNAAELGMEEFVSEDVMFDNEEENAAIMDELKRELGLDD